MVTKCGWHHWIQLGSWWTPWNRQCLKYWASGHRVFQQESLEWGQGSGRTNERQQAQHKKCTNIQLWLTCKTDKKDDHRRNESLYLSLINAKARYKDSGWLQRIQQNLMNVKGRWQADIRTFFLFLRNQLSSMLTLDLVFCFKSIG